MRTKLTTQEMEEAIQKFPFEQIAIIRPSFLAGKRREFRAGERLGLIIAKILSPFMLGPLKKYKPIHVKRVVKAMLRIANSKKPKIIYESNELRKLGVGE